MKAVGLNAKDNDEERVAQDLNSQGDAAGRVDELDEVYILHLVLGSQTPSISHAPPLMVPSFQLPVESDLALGFNSIERLLLIFNTNL